MALKPWEKYETQEAKPGPWTKYGDAKVAEEIPSAVEDTFATKVSKRLESIPSSPAYQGAKKLYGQYKASPFYQASPTGLLERAERGVTKGFNVAGEKTAEFFGQRQVNPNIAAGVGTVVQMVPDIALSGAGPIASQARRIGKYVPDVAIPFGRRALGAASSMLKTPNARRQANVAAKTALQEGVIPRTGSPDTMFKRASDISQKTGKAIGETTSKVGFEKIAPEAEYDLELLREQLTKGTKKGLFAGAHEVINTIKTTISELYGQQGVTASTYNTAKNILGNSLNFFADINSQGTNKKVVNSMADTIRSVIKKHLPASYDEFLNNQRLFNSAETMKKGLNPELAKQMGNRMISPYTALAGVSKIAAGQPGQAAAVMGVAEPAMRRGTGVTARALTSAGRSAPTAGVAATEATRASGNNKKPKKVRQNGVTYILNEETGEYE